VVAYLALSLWFGGLLAPRDYFRLALGLLALGGGIEIAQGLMGLGARRTGTTSTRMRWVWRWGSRCAWRV